jgi:hypothetical protein
MRKTPITLFADDDVNEKLQEKLERLGMDKSEYISSLILNDSDEDEEYPEDDEEEETLSGLETLGRIEDITKKDDLISSLEERNKELEEKLSKYEDYKAINQIFEVLEGHTLTIPNTDSRYEIKSKADFLRCLVHNYYLDFDPSHFGLEYEDFFGEDED